MKKLLDILKKAVSTVTGWIKSNGIEGVLGLLAGCVLWIMGYKIWAGFALGVFFVVLFITSLAFKALTTYATLRFANMRQLSISKRLVESLPRRAIRHIHGARSNSPIALRKKTS